MGKLVYSMITSLDGYVSDASGRFEWGVPDHEVHAFINEVSRGIGTSLLGRNMYRMMLYWEQFDLADTSEPVAAEYAHIWQGYDKVVFSTTLAEVSSARTRIERVFDADAVRALVAASPLNTAIDGPTLAEHALRAGLVDEIAVYVCPIVLGGGLRFYPEGVGLELELLEERSFAGGFVYLRYAVQRA